MRGITGSSLQGRTVYTKKQKRRFVKIVTLNFGLKQNTLKATKTIVVFVGWCIVRIKEEL